MRPFVIKGHERSLTRVAYNADGDLLFSSAKDHRPCVYFADNGERIGTYEGHNGTVWWFDIARDSSRLLTASADMTVRIWDVETGSTIHKIDFPTPVRSVDWAYGDEDFLAVTDQVMGKKQALMLWNFPKNGEPPKTAYKEFTNKGGPKITQAFWGPLNKTIVTAHEDGSICILDAETGEEKTKVEDHKNVIKVMNPDKDNNLFITASSDQTSRLYETRTLKCHKTYETTRPLNAAAISPLMPHVALGGGQDAQSVTTTHSKHGKFETIFYHKVYCDEIGTVKGHFGPVNTLAFNPDGKSFTSGSEDGYIRIHNFDPQYYKLS